MRPPQFEWWQAATRSTRRVQRPSPPRSQITSFSARSRRRLVRTLAAVRWHQPGRQCFFVTLTFHEVPERWHADWLAFLACARRARASWIWRLEEQRRGAPHWHLILWTTRETLAKLRDDWHRIAGHGSYRHKRYGWHQTELTSYRKASSYLSKYVAKVTAESGALATRRRWGVSRCLPVAIDDARTLTRAEYARFARVARRLVRSYNRSRRPRSLWYKQAAYLRLNPADMRRLLALFAPDAPRADAVQVVSALTSSGIARTDSWPRAGPNVAPNRDVVPRFTVPQVVQGVLSLHRP